MLAKTVILLMVYSHLAAGEEIGIPEIPELVVYQSGLASWYGSGVANDHGLHGAITATGEAFDPSKRSCASRSIPLNTVVVVELQRTGKRITCRVNDRGPYGAMHNDEWILKLSRGDPGEWRGVMDLSRRAAQDLGFNFRQGMENISILHRR